LIDNAYYALDGTGGVIQLNAQQSGRSIRIEIEDDGPGVPKDLRDQIFEPFFTTDRKEVGTGLGLAISGKLIADFGGTLSYEPIDTGGARFVIEIPEGPRAQDIAPT
jgi:C4-dicarboxylate-specific signal transduction histidine kinase